MSINKRKPSYLRKTLFQTVLMTEFSNPVFFRLLQKNNTRKKPFSSN